MFLLLVVCPLQSWWCSHDMEVDDGFPLLQRWWWCHLTLLWWCSLENYDDNFPVTQMMMMSPWQWWLWWWLLDTDDDDIYLIMMMPTWHRWRQWWYLLDTDNDDASLTPMMTMMMSIWKMMTVIFTWHRWWCWHILAVTNSHICLWCGVQIVSSGDVCCLLYMLRWHFFPDLSIPLPQGRTMTKLGFCRTVLSHIWSV